MPSETPVNVVCAVIQHEGLILLAQRPEGKRLARLWEFPGGKVDPGEQLEQALHRELQEELGCQVTVLHSGPPVLHGYPWGEIQLHPFLCELTAHSPAPQAHEHLALCWCARHELQRPDLAPADVPVLEWLETLA